MNTLPTISVPEYSVTIPSTNESVTYRPYLVREEKVLMIALESDDNIQIEDAIINIISECVDYKGDIRNLTSYDVEYMFLQLRSKSVGETIEIIKICNECDYHNEVTLSIDKAIVKNNNGDISNTVRLSSDLALELTRPTISSKMKLGDELTDTEVLIKSAANVLSVIYHGEETYNAKDVPIEERIEFIEGLSNSQFEDIINYLLDAPYVYYEDTFTCSKCGHKEEFNYTGLIDFFI